MEVPENPKKRMGKISKEDEQTLADFSSAHHCLQANCQLVPTSYIKQIKFFLYVVL